MALLQIDDLQKVFYTPDGNVSNVIYVPELTLEWGESLVLDGPSGCGKTTILHLISGLLKADSGSIEFDGRQLLELDATQRAQWRSRNIGYILQKLNLLEELTVLEMCCCPCAGRPRPWIWRALRRGLRSFCSRLAWRISYICFLPI